MKTMTLTEVQAKTGRTLSYEEAKKLANPHEPFLSNMILALNLMTWQNSAEDWLRLQAAMVVRKATRAAKRKRAAA
jgi:hypothetical protein